MTDTEISCHLSLASALKSHVTQKALVGMKELVAWFGLEVARLVMDKC